MVIGNGFFKGLAILDLVSVGSKSFYNQSPPEMQISVCSRQQYIWNVDGVYSLVVRACGLEYGGREFESRSLHLKPETKLREERGLSGCRKGLKTVPLAQALLSLKPAKTTTTFGMARIEICYHYYYYYCGMPHHMCS